MKKDSKTVIELDDGTFQSVSVEGKVRKICGANKASGGICHGHPSKGSRRCRRHGGESLRGPAHPRFKHGRYSKTLPARYREAVGAFLNDPSLMDVQGHVALLMAREEELLGQLDTGEHGDAWKRAQSHYDDLIEAIQLMSTDPVTAQAAQREALTGLRAAIRSGQADEKVWKELRENMGEKAKLVEVHRKRQMSLSSYLTADQAMALIMQIVMTARDVFTNRREMAKFSRRIGELTDFSSAAEESSEAQSK